jgi:hypothetical protein
MAGYGVIMLYGYVKYGMVDWTLWIKDWNPRPCTTPPLIPNSQIFEPTTMHYTTTTDPQKVIDSNPRSCTTPQLLTPKSQRFEPTIMHCTTYIDPKKSKTHYTIFNWCPLERQRFEPTAMHYTTIDPRKVKFEPTNMHYTTIGPQKTKIRTQDHALHHYWQPPLFNGTAFMVIDDVTANINQKHLYYRNDATIGPFTRHKKTKQPRSHPDRGSPLPKWPARVYKTEKSE